LEYFNETLPIHLTLGEIHPYVGIIYLNIGIVYEQQLKYDVAMDYLSKVLPIFLTQGSSAHEHAYVSQANVIIARSKKAQGVR